MQLTNDDVPQSNLSWNFQRWIVMSLITGMIATLLVILTLTARGFSEEFNHYNIVVILGWLGLIIGSIFGAAQALILRKVLPQARLWFFATLAGWFCGAIGYGMFLANPSSAIVGFALFGLPIILPTFFQWLVIWCFIPKSGWWIGINIGATFLLLLIGVFSDPILVSLIVLIELVKAFTMDKLFKSSTGLYT